MWLLSVCVACRQPQVHATFIRNWACCRPRLPRTMQPVEMHVFKLHPTHRR